MPKKRGHGEGEIRQRPDGRWEVRVRVGVARNGKPQRKSLYGDTKAEVVAKLRLHQREQESGLHAIADELSVEAWLDRWLEQKKGNVEPNSYVWYERRVRLHLKPILGDLQLAKLTSLDVVYLQTEMIKRGDSASEIHKAMTVLRAALKQAMRLKLVRENVALAVDKPKKPKRGKINPLSVEQARTFLDAARGIRLGALFVLALDAGLRPGESFAIHWDCVDLDAGTVRVAWSLEEINGKARLKEPKTEKARRTLPIAPRTVEALRAHRDRMKAEGRDVEKGLVFVTTDGGWLLQANFYRNVFTPLRKAAKLVGVRPYDLRHTCATLLLAHGVNVKIVSERLGHEDIQTTLKHYAHVLPGMQEQAVRVVTALFGEADVARPPQSANGGQMGVKPPEKEEGQTT